MCLTISIKLPRRYQTKADLIADKASTENFAVFKEKRWFGKLPRLLFLSSDAGCCACDLLSDDADWNAHCWDFNESYLSSISEALFNISKEIKEDFLFQALWAGDRPSTTHEVTVAELSQIIIENKVETKATYHVIAPDSYRNVATKVTV